MTTNHPAHGPVSLDRLHQIREILSKAAAQSDGGNLGYAMADAVKVIDEMLAIPTTLPCPVHLDPGLKFGKGVRTQCLMDALRRRSDYYAELEAMTPEQRAEHDAGIAEFKAMIGNGGRGDMIDNDQQHAIHTAPTLDADGESAFPQHAMQSFGNSEQLDEVGSWNNHLNTPTAQAGNSPVTPDSLVNHENDKTERLAYSVNEFGFFSAYQGSDNKINLRVNYFEFSKGNTNAHKDSWHVEKFMVQGVINKLQEACDAMSDELIINAEGKSAFHRAPTQDTWIPVSERMPEGSEEVLCTKEFDGPGDWRKKVGYWHEGKWVVYGASWTPTHWMPLPAAPQQ